MTTPFEANFMKELGARDEKIFLFPGGIDDEDIASLGKVDLLRVKYGLPQDAKLVSCLGTVEERKNPLALVEVAKLLADRADIRLVIAGRAEGEYADRLKEAASKLPNVSVLGSISDEDKAALIRTSLANITMSRSESLGIAQLEFMSAGVPVITSGVGGQSWIVGNGSNGVVLNGPEDVKGAAQAIKNLADRPRLRRKLGKVASRTASSYSLTRLVDALLARLQRQMRGLTDDMPALRNMPGDERIIEAWVHKGRKVAATSKRLIVRSAKGGREVTTILYDDIARIERHLQAPWALLGFGALATTLLLGQRVLGLGMISSLGPEISAALSPLGLSWMTGTLVAAVPFMPVLVAAAVFFPAVKRGYLVHYGSSRKLFLPERFGKALKLADKLTSRDLFGADGEPLSKRN